MSQQLAIAKSKEVFAKAKELYPHLSFDKVSIRFDLVGQNAGMAARRGSRGNFNYFIRLNADMLTREAADHIINETVPHEIAHIICFMDPSLGRGHDIGWERVCRKLGGAGGRCHQEQVVYGKGRTFEYTSTTGHKVRLSEQRHKKIQAGISMEWRRKGITNKQCAYEVVGYQGRTLKTPIVKKAALAAGLPIINTTPTSRSPEDYSGIPTTVATLPNPLPPGKYVGADQYPAEFGKAFTSTDQYPPTTKALVRTTVARTPVTLPAGSGSKAAISRGIMLAGYRAGKAYEEVIAEMMATCGYNRQLARGTFKANASKIGIPGQY